MKRGFCKGLLRRTLLTCQSLVPLANAARLSTESFDVFQVGLWVEKPLGLWWGSHKHRRCWLLYDRGASWMWARIWRWCLLPWRPQNSYLKEHRPHSEGKKYSAHVLRKKIRWILSSPRKSNWEAHLLSIWTSAWCWSPYHRGHSLVHHPCNSEYNSTVRGSGLTWLKNYCLIRNDAIYNASLWISALEPL